MKRCLICHHPSPSDAATCPRCGEASWSAPEAEPEAQRTEPVQPQAPAPALRPQPFQQTKRGRR